MKKYFDLSKRRIHPAIFLLAVAFLAYGLFFWKRGFYWDEFPWAWIYFRLGPDVLTKTFSTSRPFWGMIYQLTLPVIGPNPWAWQLIAVFMRWITALLFWMVLRAMWPQHPRPALWASLLFLVYPGMGQHFISMMYSHFYIVLSCYLLSLYLTILAVRSEKYRLALWAASCLFAAVNLLTMEYFYFLEFARLFLIWQVLEGSVRVRLRKTALYFTPFLAIFLGVTFWRMFFFTFQNASYKYVLLDAIKADPVSGLWLLAGNVLLSFWRTVFEVWIYPFFTIGMTGLGPLTLILMLVLLYFVILLVGIFLFIQDPDQANDLDFARRASLIGLVFWGLSGGSVWIIGIVPQLNFSIDRFMLPFMLGASLLIACLIALIKNRRSQMIVLALLVGFAVSRQFRLEEVFRSDWATQQNLFWQMSWRMPALEKGSILISNDIPVTYYSDNSLTGPLNWIYSPPGEMNVVLYFASVRVGKKLPSLEPGQSHELYYVGPTFYGNTSNILIFNFEPPGCLRIIDPEVDGVNRLLPQSLRTITQYSHQDVIGFDREAVLPRQFYGDEPPHGWCFYFEQADLARQQGDWAQVVELANNAFALDDHPNDPAEYFVFIEAYAHQGEWQKAMELSRIAYKTSKYYVGPPLCKLWTRIGRQTVDTPEQKVTMESVQNKFECVP
ncbi:MAG: tetratricopeptide repeat protein [Chloroflexi bacterium]|nr:tetratricopeptide repeat protein [Chloroflexota bacterium]